jgi:hypothetical protein
MGIGLKKKSLGDLWNIKKQNLGNLILFNNRKKSVVRILEKYANV